MPKGFFRAVWRFNALAIAAVSCLALFVGAYAAFQIARDVFHRPYQAHDIARVETKDGAAVPPRVRTDLSVASFSPIRGTETLWAHLTAKQAYDFRYSSKEASSTRNVIFYDVKSGRSRKLLSNDNAVIVDTRELREDDPKGTKPPKALLFSFIEKDTNGDGILNHQDGVTLALAQANGEGLTRIEEASGQLKGETLVAAANEIVVMNERDGALKALHIDLATFKVTKSEAVVR
jgi:hypothetical protein